MFIFKRFIKGNDCTFFENKKNNRLYNMSVKYFIKRFDQPFFNYFGHVYFNYMPLCHINNIKKNVHYSKSYVKKLYIMVYSFFNNQCLVFTIISLNFTIVVYSCFSLKIVLFLNCIIFFLFIHLFCYLYTYSIIYIL